MSNLTTTGIEETDPPDISGEEVSVNRPTRVLLAEDDPDMRFVLAMYMRQDGYEVVEVADGTELEAVIRAAADGTYDQEPVDMVVSDVRMPGKNSLDVLRGLRRLDWVVPIVLITAFGSAEVHAEARRLGVRTVLNKPFNLNRLRELLQSITPAA